MAWACCNLDALRRCVDRAQLCVQWLRTIQVTVRVVSWDGGYMGRGTGTPTNLTLTPRYQVKQVSAREVAASGGLYELEDLKVGPITPEWTVGAESGGYSPAELAPEGDETTEVVYILTGDVDGTYARVSLDTTDPLQYFLVLRNTARTPRRVP